MSVFDKLLDSIKLNDDDYDEDSYLDEDLMDDDEDGDFLDDDLMDDKPKKKFFEKFGRKKEETAAEDDDFEEEPVHTAAPKATAKAPVKQPAEKQRPAASSKITPMRSSRRANQASSMEVCVIKPASMEDTREIADTLLDNATVILNLEGIDVELAQRIIDFASGACYSLNGSLQKISSYIFVLGPSSVDITGDLQNILGGATPSVRAGY
ncbi:cell division protein SepF [Blautia sp. HCP3S3_H10_1]|uniref:cell division protein SepF n=1 Tax=unclassified Blautia TaxID=2648079 RepID=UPI003F939E5A|nr:cell division protein SepF [Clostridia bacterium]